MSCRKEAFHNAGNDARFALRALLLMAVEDYRNEIGQLDEATRGLLLRISDIGSYPRQLPPIHQGTTEQPPEDKFHRVANFVGRIMLSIKERDRVRARNLLYKSRLHSVIGDEANPPVWAVYNLREFLIIETRDTPVEATSTAEATSSIEGFLVHDGL
jgi:hypothetical protein